MEEKELQKQELVDVSSLGLPEEELFAHYDNSGADAEKITAPRYSYWKSVFKVFFKKKINIIALAILGIVLIMTYVYPAIVHYDVLENLAIQAEAAHLRTAAAFAKFGKSIRWCLGTGALGQSVFDSIWNGSRSSISLAVICAAINMVIGVVVGAVWGFSKRVDAVMNEVYNIIGNIPYILLIGIMVKYIPTDPTKPNASFWRLVFALTITGWLGIAYFIRTQVIIIRDREYNLASRCLGTPITRVVTKNILPFMTSIIVTLLATELPSYISYEVFLIYIGLGTSTDSLGFLIADSESRMLIPGQSIEFWAPVVVTAIITIVLFLVGQNLGDASDPKTHR